MESLYVEIYIRNIELMGLETLVLEMFIVFFGGSAVLVTNIPLMTRYATSKLNST